MGVVNLPWYPNFDTALAGLGIEASDASFGKYKLRSLEGKDIIVHFVPLNNDFEPHELLALQERYVGDHKQLVHLWEDVWLSRSFQVLGRIRSLSGLNQRIHARKTKILVITQVEADAFLEKNHIQASARAKYRYALMAGEEMVAVACFSGLRLMRNRNKLGYRSAEVIRFASLTGFTVIGGFSKILKYFVEQLKPDDVMSYADRDWSNGKVYEQAGFKLVSVVPGSYIYLEMASMRRYFPHRMPELANSDSISINEAGFVKVFNTGNLKYIYYL